MKDRCPVYHKFVDEDSLPDKLSQKMVIQYIFKTDAALRVNVTFLQFELTQVEKVQIWNAGFCPHFFINFF